MIVPRKNATQCSGIKATVILVSPSCVQLSVESPASCVRCQNGRGCGLGFNISAQPTSEKQTRESLVGNAGPVAGMLTLEAADVRVLDSNDQIRGGALNEVLKIGEEARLLLPRPALMRFIVIALLVPAFMMMVLSSLGHAISPSMGFSANAGALLGIVAGFFAGAFLARLCYPKTTGNIKKNTFARASGPVYLIPNSSTGL